MNTVFRQELFAKAVDKTITTAESMRKIFQYDTIAFSGVSGAAMAFILSHWLSVPLLCVRRAGDNSHYFNGRHSHCEGNFDAKRYMIVDDFISSGSTVNYIIDTIYKEVPAAKCVGMLMYAQTFITTHSNPHLEQPVEVAVSRIPDLEPGTW
jgi:orotate phosphoribosyltransferase-like protein